MEEGKTPAESGRITPPKGIYQINVNMQDLFGLRERIHVRAFFL
jgi:hypothetical protein